jgi:hypothetical protein
LLLPVLLTIFFAAPAVSGCPLGDLDGDCGVSVEDLLVFAEQWLDSEGCSEPNCADFDDSNDIDAADFALLAGNWRVKVGPLLINEFMASNNSTIKDPQETGEFPDWIELYNGGTTIIELAGMYLTDDLYEPTKWQIPAGVTIEPGEHLLFWADGEDEQGDYHTNFQLDRDGDEIGLFDTNGVTLIDSITFGQQRYDVSCGRFPDANDSWCYSVSPTPGAENNDGYLGIVADTKFSINRGFYDRAFDVVIDCDTNGATIRYTLDYTEPNETHGTVYSSPINITATTCLRAAAFKAGWLATNVDTQTYIFLDQVITQSPNGEKPGSDWPDPCDGPDQQWIDYGMDPNVVNDTNYIDLMDDALLSVPTISLVTDLENLFNTSNEPNIGGIYMNADGRGIGWERPTSVELINPDGSEGFQVDAGIRIRGGISRNDDNPKHSLRLFFRSDYGDAKLKFPLFGDEGVDEFDHLDLRCGQNFSWNLMGLGKRATQSRVVFSRDSQRDMGRPYTRSRYYHVYINGQYWGLYQSQERSEASFAESYLGGADNNYDVIKVDVTQGDIIEATDGQLDAYQELWWYADQGFDSDWAYYRAQGLNTNGTPSPLYDKLLDVDNLIDYMIVIYYTGNRDGPIGIPGVDNRPRNFYAIYNRNDPDGFKYFAHDSEYTLEEHLSAPRGVYEDRTTAGTHPDLTLEEYFGPMWLQQRLTAHPEYVMRFADHVHKHFFNDGVLTPAASTARFMDRANEIDMAIIAESARWGDAKRTTPYTKNDDWLPCINAIVDDYFNHDPNTRTDIVLDQFIEQDWYPDIEAPTFNQHGGEVNAPFELTMSAPEYTIYYTTDGNDPRLRGGSVSPSAIEYIGPITLTNNTHVKARVLDDDEWSALTEAVFAVSSVADNLRITEIMYHPNDINDPDIEFIELKNIGPNSINLNLVSFTDGIDFTFPPFELDPNGCVVVVKDQSAFEAEYGTGPNVAGQYSGQLNNAGERIKLEDAIGQTILNFRFKDGWYPITDGSGFSLTIIDPYNPDLNSWEYQEYWQPSSVVKGTPGAADSGHVAAPADIVINEILTHSDGNPYDWDWIELHNTTDHTINIGGWFLSDHDANFRKYEIATGDPRAPVPAGGYVVFTQTGDFGNQSDPGCHKKFGLSELGETVYLCSGSGGQLTGGFCAHEDFAASEADVTFGRYTKSPAAANDVDFVPMSTYTYSSENTAGPKVGPIVITEIMYHPNSVNQLDNYAEYVELYNTSGGSVTLDDWLFTDETDDIEFYFPPGTTLGSGQRLLLVKNLSIFEDVFGTPGVTAFEWLSGRLNNAGEKIQLSKPGEQEPNGFIPYYRVDRVNYSDGNHPENFHELGYDPWPTSPDGSGDSLHRITLADYGNDVVNWTAGTPTPGS